MPAIRAGKKHRMPEVTIASETLAYPPRFLAYLRASREDARKVNPEDFVAWTLTRYKEWIRKGRLGTFTHFCFGDAA